jgi:hypothetical protein
MDIPTYSIKSIKMAKKMYICREMKKELGKWLMDIAKYITTAVILTSIFSDVGERWILYCAGAISAVLTLICGLILIKDKKEN